MIDAPFLIINRTREIEVPAFQSSMQGFYKLVKEHESGIITYESDWFPNLITNAGLNRMGTDGVTDAISIGTGITTPNVTDTALAVFAARSTTAGSGDGTFGNFGAPTYTAWRNVAKRFNFGVLNGNYTEVSVDYNAGGGTYVTFSRALILDGGGNPTTITVLPTEALTVYYQLRRVPVLTDTLSTITIGPTVHDTVTRVANVQGSRVTIPIEFCGQVSGLTACRIWSGASAAIGSITSSPSGTSSMAWSYTNSAYVNNSLEKTGSITLHQDGPNPAYGSFKVLEWGGSGFFNSYQVSFDPVVPKDNTRNIVFYGKTTWARV